jgi:hypothetical protein
MPERWAHVVYLDDWELGVPGMEPIVEELVGWCIAKGLCCAAQILSQNMMIKYQVDRVVVEKAGDFVRKQFADQHTAISWLEEQGFEAKEALMPSYSNAFSHNSGLRPGI